MVQPVSVSFVWLPHGRGLEPPARQSAGAAAVDLRAALAPEARLVISSGRRALVPTGMAIALPRGHEAQVRPRSGLALKHGVTVLNAPGTIDADYRGEIGVLLINHGDEDFVVRRGDRIAQLVVAEVRDVAFTQVEELGATSRGQGGYGSTGI